MPLPEILEAAEEALVKQAEEFYLDVQDFINNFQFKISVDMANPHIILIKCEYVH